MIKYGKHKVQAARYGSKTRLSGRASMALDLNLEVIILVGEEQRVRLDGRPRCFIDTFGGTSLNKKENQLLGTY